MIEKRWDDRAEDDWQWFRRHRGAKERVRPATIQEQLEFLESDDEVTELVRVVLDYLWSRGRCYIILNKLPA